MRWTCERTLKKYDLTFCWYRIFVQLADFANLLPQFRQLSIQDQAISHSPFFIFLFQCTLFRHNFAIMSWVYFLQEIEDVDLSLGYPFGNGAYAPMNVEDIKCTK